MDSTTEKISALFHEPAESPDARWEDWYAERIVERLTSA
jgi:hypothetical protein